MSWLGDAITAVEDVLGPTIVADIEAIFEAEFTLLLNALADVTLGVPVGSLLTNMLNNAENMGRQDILGIASKAPEALAAAASTFVAQKAITA